MGTVDVNFLIGLTRGREETFSLLRYIIYAISKGKGYLADRVRKNVLFKDTVKVATFFVSFERARTITHHFTLVALQHTALTNL